MSTPAGLDKRLYSIPRGHGWMKVKAPVGLFSTAFTRIGDTTTMVLKNTFETEDIYGNDAATKELRDRVLVQKSGDITIGVRNFTKLNRAMMFSADPNSWFTQEEIDAGEILETVPLGPNMAEFLTAKRAVITSVTSTDVVPVTYLERLHYVFDSNSGAFEIVQHPAGVTLDDEGRAPVEITYGAPELTAEDRIDYGGIMEMDDGIDTEMKFLQVGGRKKLFIELWSSKFLNQEDIVIATDESGPTSATLVGSLSPDGTKPMGKQWGQYLDA